MPSRGGGVLGQSGQHLVRSVRKVGSVRTGGQSGVALQAGVPVGVLGKLRVLEQQIARFKGLPTSLKHFELEAHSPKP